MLDLETVQTIESEPLSEPFPPKPHVTQTEPLLPDSSSPWAVVALDPWAEAWSSHLDEVIDEETT